MAKKFVVSSADPTQTFLRFVGEKHLDSGVADKIIITPNPINNAIAATVQ